MYTILDKWSPLGKRAILFDNGAPMPNLMLAIMKEFDSTSDLIVKYYANEGSLPKDGLIVASTAAHASEYERRNQLFGRATRKTA